MADETPQEKPLPPLSPEEKDLFNHLVDKPNALPSLGSQISGLIPPQELDEQKGTIDSELKALANQGWEVELQVTLKRKITAGAKA